MVAVPSACDANVTPVGRAPDLVMVATGNPLEITVNENGVPTVAETAAPLVIDGARGTCAAANTVPLSSLRVGLVVESIVMSTHAGGPSV
jgi:hypothetical protein